MEETSDEELLREAQQAPIYEVALRASISLRGHLIAALTTMREMTNAAKAGNLKELKMLGLEAEALIAENQMLGMSIDYVPSMPKGGTKITLEDVETIYGIQRARIAARDVNKDRVR